MTKRNPFIVRARRWVLAHRETPPPGPLDDSHNHRLLASAWEVEALLRAQGRATRKSMRREKEREG